MHGTAHRRPPSGLLNKMGRVTRVLLVALVCLAPTARADDVKNHEVLYGYLAGTYLAVGKELDSDNTYSGKVVFSSQEDRLIVTRNIHGETIQGIGTIEHALGPDQAHVLRVRFTRHGQEFEITYLWRHDLDNYARLSGYVYRPGEKTAAPGLETLFIDHTAKE
ncbi:MAG: hypothetical protein E4G90_08810 [Gemmatimonadales bacterium]|nr:MAG: hypothetical protein E4G90_08810 [Gemmatimonadales bacterium]